MKIRVMPNASGYYRATRIGNLVQEPYKRDKHDYSVCLNCTAETCKGICEKVEYKKRRK